MRWYFLATDAMAQVCPCLFNVDGLLWIICVKSTWKAVRQFRSFHLSVDLFDIVYITGICLCKQWTAIVCGNFVYKPKKEKQSHTRFHLPTHSHSTPKVIYNCVVVMSNAKCKPYLRMQTRKTCAQKQKINILKRSFCSYTQAATCKAIGLMSLYKYSTYIFRNLQLKCVLCKWVLRYICMRSAGWSMCTCVNLNLNKLTNTLKILFKLLV